MAVTNSKKEKNGLIMNNNNLLKNSLSVFNSYLSLHEILFEMGFENEGLKIASLFL